MVGPAAEQTVAGVALSERLAVTMYGAIHRAQWAGQRNLRGLVVDPKLLGDPAFRGALGDAAELAKLKALDHPGVEPIVTVETGEAEVVVVTRGVGRHVTVQDLIAAARASREDAGKLAPPVAAAIGKAVIEALAVAHRAGVVHGAIHPRSVVIDVDGAVRLGDFAVGRALTTAIGQGADAALWRGLAGFIAPELVVGEPPTPASDVFALGALLFTMLSGAVPPGTLHVTPAVERLVQRALDTDLGRRYGHAGDLLDNLIEALEDDRWSLASRGELIKAAGLSAADDSIDDATEDLLASLASPKAVQASPIRPNIDLRAEVAAARQGATGASANRLDLLLADLEDSRELTEVDDVAKFKRDPISEIIAREPREREAIVQARRRVPSIDDVDDDAPHDAPARAGSSAERAAMDALAGLDAPVRLSSAADAAEVAAAKLEHAARRAEQAAARVGTRSELAPSAPRPAPPIVDPIADLDAPPPRVKGRIGGVIGAVVLFALIGGVAYLIVTRGDESQRASARAQAEADAEHDRKRREAEQLAQQLTTAHPDPGAIVVKSTPVQGGAWLKLGRTPLTTAFSLPSAPAGAHSLEIRIELDGFQPVDTQITNAHWSGDPGHRSAKITVPLAPIRKRGHGAVRLPPTPPEPPAAPPGPPSRGPVSVDSTPPGAEVWLFIGVTDQVRLDQIVAGRPYELRVLADGYLPGFASITAEDWRDPADDPHKPIDVANKRAVIEKTIALVRERK